MCDFTSFASGRCGGGGCWRYKMIIINMMDLTLKCSWFSRREREKNHAHLRAAALPPHPKHKQLSNFASHGSFFSASRRCWEFFSHPQVPLVNIRQETRPWPNPKLQGKIPGNLWSDRAHVCLCFPKGSKGQITRLNEKEWAKCVFLFISIYARACATRGKAKRRKVYFVVCVRGDGDIHIVKSEWDIWVGNDISLFYSNVSS